MEEIHEPSPSKKVHKEEETALEILKHHSIIVADTGNFKEIQQYEPQDATTNPSLILQAAGNKDYFKLITDAIEYAKQNLVQQGAQKLERRTSLRGKKRKSYIQMDEGDEEDKDEGESGKKSKSKSKQIEADEKQHDETNTPQKSTEQFDFDSLTVEQKTEFLHLTIDKIAVNFGVEISKLISGYISTEVDARLSFDKKATMDRAKRIIKLYEEQGIDKSRILIKIASTWEGIEAAKALKKEGISTNLTLLFSFCQAVACADAKVTLISPFVGRILDWYQKNQPKAYDRTNDPGVLSVKEIFKYYKKFQYQTIIMGASFRNADEILELSGCDRLTISPKFLEELKNMKNKSVPKILDSLQCENLDIDKQNMDEKTFRWMLNQDAMATEKLAEGIRKFAEDTEKLEKIILDEIKKSKSTTSEQNGDKKQ